MNEWSVIAGALILIGIVLFVVSRRDGGGRSSVTADRGSAAVGGSNSGNISVSNTNASKDGEGSNRHLLTVIAVLVELAGIGTALWEHFSPHVNR